MKKGFTLLEILLVIAVIGILSAIILISINPNRQLAQARDSVRQSDITSLQKAIEQYGIDNAGLYVNLSITTIPQYICDTGNISEPGAPICPPGTVDLRSLVPNYLAVIPKDSQASNNTGYKVAIHPNNRISISSALSENKVISVNPILAKNTIEKGLVFYLDANNSSSYPGTGSTWFDLSGRGYNVSLFNNPTFSDGYMQFRNILNQYATTSFDEGVLKSNNTSGSWTLDIVFRYVSAPSTPEAVLLGRQGCHGGIYINPASSLQHAIKTNACWTGAIQRDVITMIPGNIYHTTMVYNGGFISHYVNGIISSPTSLNTSLYTVNNHNNMVYIGGINAGAGWYTNSDIALIRAYNTALTTDEVQQNFIATKDRFGL